MCVCVCVCVRVCSVQFALRTRTKGMGGTKVGSLSHFFHSYFHSCLKKIYTTEQDADPLAIPTNTHIIKEFPPQFTEIESSLT